MGLGYDMGGERDCNNREMGVDRCGHSSVEIGANEKGGVGRNV